MSESEKETRRSTKYFIAAFASFCLSILCITLGGYVFQAIGYALIMSAGFFYGKSSMFYDIESGVEAMSADVSEEDIKELERITGQSLEGQDLSQCDLQINLDNLSEHDKQIIERIFNVDIDRG